MSRKTTVSRKYTVTEIDADAVPPARESAQVWQQFYYDIKLRLERTPPSRALRAEFADVQSARYAHAHLTKRFRKYVGTGAVECRSVQEDGRGVLYIRRGPQFGKEPNGTARSKMQDVD